MIETPSQTPPEDPAGPSDGSRLCLECGLCCRGVIHKRADLDNSELTKAGRLGLRVVGAASKQPAFELPCIAFDRSDDRCSIYDDRFAVCRRYRCHLLRRLEDGSVSMTAALATVSRARELADRLGRRTSELARPETTPEPETVLDLAELRRLVDREFSPQDGSTD